jgi:hypothetical protein
MIRFGVRPAVDQGLERRGENRMRRGEKVVSTMVGCC